MRLLNYPDFGNTGTFYGSARRVERIEALKEHGIKPIVISSTRYLFASAH
jgi:hypothetical protein